MVSFSAIKPDLSLSRGLDMTSAETLDLDERFLQSNQMSQYTMLNSRMMVVLEVRRRREWRWAS